MNLKKILSVCVIVVAMPFAIKAADLYVSADGTGTDDSVYGTLADAIAAAQKDDRILLNEGIHEVTAPISVNKKVTITSASGRPEGTIVLGAFNNNTKFSRDLSTEGAAVSNLTFTSGGKNGLALSISKKDCIADNLIITNNVGKTATTAVVISAA